MSKGSKKKTDDYYDNGCFELARFGKVVSLRNKMMPEQHSQYIDLLASHFEEAKNNINARIRKIKDSISTCDPLEILNFSVSMSFMSMMNKLSETQYTADEDFTFYII